jgi:beta-glucosidase
MKYFFSLAALVIIYIIFTGFHNQPEKFDPKSDTVDKVKKLLSEMTLEEKVGQMTQVTIQVVSSKQGTKDQHHELDEKKLEEAVVKYKVGSLLNVYDVAHEIDYWHEVITRIEDLAVNKTRLGIPVLYGIDAIHGATYTKGSTLFPQGINMAATWNKDLVEKIGEITSFETRASGIPWNFYPVMDIGRQPLWPRLWETYGEDVYLASQTGASYIKGAQGNDIGASDKLAVCLKHYVGYGFPNNGRDRTPAWISERMMREYFLPTFEAGIKAGAPTVMVNSGEVDGIPTHSDYHLLTEVLRGEMNFKGFVVSDWEDIKRLHTRDRVADTPKEAVRMAVMAGVDMSMIPLDYSFYDYLLELVNEGSVPMWRIDEAVGRILTVKIELGLFDNPFPNKEMKKKFANDDFAKINLQAARESIVLTKNENDLLPLKKDTKVLVTGPTANMLSVMNGGWTITWQGNVEELYPQEKNTVLEAIKNKVGEDKVSYVEGTSFNKEINILEAVKAAKENDVVILCLGEAAYCETPGNITDLTLDNAQLELAEKIIETGKPVVLVMLEGRPRIINSIVNGAGAVLAAFLPGMEGGNAIADIIYGDYSPSGKLSVTYPKFPNGNTTYDYKPIEKFDSNEYDPQWSFGFGLSYSTFSYSNLNLDKKEIKEADVINVSVDVKNTGKIEASEVVQLYLCDLYGSVTRPNRQLKGFEKISLKPGETRTISFNINKDHLSFIGRDNKRIVEPGEFEVMINNLKDKFILKETAAVK